MTVHVGLTYDLQSDYLTRGYTQEQVAEFDKEETIQGIEGGLQAMGLQTGRIGSIAALVEQLAAGRRWDFVFNIAEGCNGMSREAQVPALLDAYAIPYTMSDPITLAVTHHKGITKEIIRGAGLATPAFAVVKNTADAAAVRLNYPLFAKPVAEGTGKGISGHSMIRDKAGLEKSCALLLEKFGQPVLVEEFLPGREFTVGIIGNGPAATVLGVMEVVYNKGVEQVYSYETKSNYEKLVTYRLVDGELAARCGELCLDAYRVLGCRDVSRVDIRLDAQGNPHFLEVNALPGLNPPHSDLPIMGRLAGVDYNTLIRRITEAALSRFQKSM